MPAKSLLHLKRKSAYMNTENKILVIGIGNTIRGDDAIGVFIVRDLDRQNLPGIDCVVFEHAGFEAIDAIKGYKTVYIIDATYTPHCDEIGDVININPDALSELPGLRLSHGKFFPRTIEEERSLFHDETPENVSFILIKVMAVDEFREGLSPELSAQYSDILDFCRIIVSQHPPDFTI